MLDTYHISETFGDHRDPTMIVGVCVIQLAEIMSPHRPPLGGNVMRTIFVAAILGEADCLPVPDVCVCYSYHRPSSCAARLRAGLWVAGQAPDSLPAVGYA